MIKSLKINYDKENICTKYSYIKKDKNTGEPRKFLPEKIEFTNGLNILVGTNGCGKTTVINLLTDICLIYGLKRDYNFWDAVSVFYPNADGLGNEKYKSTMDVVDVENNYNYPVKRMDSLSTKKNRSGGMYDNINDFAQFFEEKTMSKGQKMMNTIYTEVLQAQKDFESYSYNKLFFPPNSANETWMKGSDMVKEYIEKHNCPDLEKRCTFLMDEPDEGLDVFNLKELKQFLEVASETCQLIVVLHNPLLIKSLSDKANIIELTPNYLNAIETF